MGEHPVTVSSSLAAKRVTTFRSVLRPVIASLCIVASLSAKSVELKGAHIQGQAITFLFKTQTQYEEYNLTTNPFIDRSLIVTFTSPSKQTVKVYGHFAADGNAANTGADTGTVWRAFLTPEEHGQWAWEVAFFSGGKVGVSLNPLAHTDASEQLIGEHSGTFRIAPSDENAPGFLNKGSTLKYVGTRHLEWPLAGQSFLKIGVNSPENLLAFADFDNTPPSHRYQAHTQDWVTGDPVWKGTRGRALIGALNYLSKKKVNSAYFLILNVGGEGNDVWPWVSPDRPKQYDVSKLDQWEIVFSHMDSLGIQLHVVTQEFHNDTLLDEGQLGHSRKLYYKEMVSRFGHHNAVVWNLGEENRNTADAIASFSQFIKALDPYGHPIALHVFPLAEDSTYLPHLGSETLEMLSFQHHPSANIYDDIVKWSTLSSDSGRPWVINSDESNILSGGALIDSESNNHLVSRTKTLWPALMAGAGGVEWYSGAGALFLILDKLRITDFFGIDSPDPDLEIENFRERENLWVQSSYALRFFDGGVLDHRTIRSTDISVNTKAALIAAVNEMDFIAYLPEGGALRLGNMPPASEFTVRRFNPRTGEFTPPKKTGLVNESGNMTLDAAPFDAKQDWAVFLEKSNPGATQ